MDLNILNALNGFAAAHDAFEDPVTFYNTGSVFLFAGLLAVLFLLGRRQGARAAVAAGAGAVLALGAAQMIAGLVDRPRPYADHALHVFVARSSDPSFPSDHTTAAFAIAVAVWLRFRRLGWVTLAFAAALAVGRVFVGAHYPSDIVAGAALGSLAALVLWAPPLRRLTDRVADLAAGVWIAVLGAGRRSLRPG